MKRIYKSPRLVVYGKVEEITQGDANGDYTDAAFPAKTPKDQLTFS